MYGPRCGSDSDHQPYVVDGPHRGPYVGCSMVVVLGSGAEFCIRGSDVEPPVERTSRAA